jgi:hypothetical protein
VGATTPNTGAFTTTTVSTSETLSYGTANGVAYLNGSKVVTSGSALTFDGTNFSVTNGFGTFQANQAGVYVKSTGAFSPFLNFYSSTTTLEASVYAVAGSSALAFALTPAATEQMRLTSTGLGIGVTSPSVKLDVNGSAQLRANGYLLFLNSDNTNNYFVQNGGATGSGNADLRFLQNGVGERMRLDSSGNLGIGTSSPVTKLDVNGGAQVTGSVSGYGGGEVRLGPTTADTQSAISTRSTGSPALLFDHRGTSNTGTFVWRNGTGGASTLMTLDGSGKLSLGSTSNTNQYIELNCGTTANNQLRFVSNGTYYGGIVGVTGLGVQVAANAVPISFSLDSGGTKSMTLDTSGNLGLGVTPSAQYSTVKALQVGALGATIILGNTSAGGTSAFGQNYYTDPTTAASKYAASSYPATAYHQYNGEHRWFNAPSGTAGSTITFTQAMTLDASGRLGIGTSSPTYKLEVYESSAAGLDGLKLSNTEGSFVIRVNDDNAFLQANTTVFRNTAETERMRIDSSGRVLVGTSTFSTVSGGLISDYNSGTSTHYIGHISGAASGSGYSVFQYNGVAIGSITQSGTTAVLYNTTSDQRLKENIQDADSASSLIDSLQVRKFDWKSDNSHQRYGFVAQELVTVAPEAVHQPADEEEMMAVDYSKLVPMLVKEIQSLRKRLAALEAK